MPKAVVDFADNFFLGISWYLSGSGLELCFIFYRAAVGLTPEQVVVSYVR